MRLSWWEFIPPVCFHCREAWPSKSTQADGLPDISGLTLESSHAVCAGNGTAPPVEKSLRRAAAIAVVPVISCTSIAMPCLRCFLAGEYARTEYHKDPPVPVLAPRRYSVA